MCLLDFENGKFSRSWVVRRDVTGPFQAGRSHSDDRQSDVEVHRRTCPSCREGLQEGGKAWLTGEQEVLIKENHQPGQQVYLLIKQTQDKWISSVYICVHMSLCATCACNIHRGQKWVSGLRTKSGSFCESIQCSNRKAISPIPGSALKKKKS